VSRKEKKRGVLKTARSQLIFFSNIQVSSKFKSLVGYIQKNILVKVFLFSRYKKLKICSKFEVSFSFFLNYFNSVAYWKFRANFQWFIAQKQKEKK
jgi:hypothetical protein